MTPAIAFVVIGGLAATKAHCDEKGLDMYQYLGTGYFG